MRVKVSAAGGGKPVARTEYPGEFSRFWEAIASPRPKGLKSEALKRWRERGSPPAELLTRKWGEYLASLGDTYPKDVCRWIAYRGFEEVYEPAPVPAVRLSRAAALAAGHAEQETLAAEWAEEGRP